MNNNSSKDGKLTSGANISYWIDSIDPLVFTTLDKDIETDVIIIGGGIAGITIAYCLLQEGKKVVVVEDGYIGSGETGHTTGHLASAIDDHYYILEKIFGEEQTHLIANSHRTAIDFIEQIIQKENIDCDFERVPGYLFLHPTDEKDTLQKELAAAKRAGLEVIEMKHIPGMIHNEQPCLAFANQAQFHSLKYIHGLCKAIETKGGQIFTDTHADKISQGGIITTSGFKVNAKFVVVATNSPVNNKYVMHLKQSPHRTYVIAAKIKKDSISNALWWDTGDHKISSTIPPYHYIRIQKFDDQYDLLLCGGEDHPTGISGEYFSEKERYKLLENWTREHFNIEEVSYQWSGQVIEPLDHLAFIGHNPFDKENIFIVTGDSGNGLTHATIAGILITDLIQGKKNKWEEIYSPSRLKLATASKVFFKDILGEFATYFKTKPRPIELEQLNDLKMGEAQMFILNKEAMGVYRDESGQIHIVSAKCTHLGCTIQWNADEKSWDCPCHGSRYTYEGKVINGPANKDLSYYKDSSEKKEMNTLVECMAHLNEKGFKENFIVKDNRLYSSTTKKTYSPEEVKIVNFYRFEGESDPADNSILYAIETNDGVKGAVSDAYGLYADGRVSKFINEVEEMVKGHYHHSEH